MSPQAGGAQQLTMSKVSAYFHLSGVDAARELGVSVDTLKRACRQFGLKRWPAREVRNVESSMHRLKHAMEQAMAVSEGAGRELAVAYLQQVMVEVIQNGSQAHVRHTMNVHRPHHLRMTDLFPCFHLSLTHAAKEMNVSQSTLKKECRRLGLIRWPGRNARSLLSRIQELVDAIGTARNGQVYDPSGPSASAA